MGSAQVFNPLAPSPATIQNDSEAAEVEAVEVEATEAAEVEVAETAEVEASSSVSLVSTSAYTTPSNPYMTLETEEENLENDYYFKEKAWAQGEKLAE